MATPRWPLQLWRLPLPRRSRARSCAGKDKNSGAHYEKAGTTSFRSERSDPRPFEGTFPGVLRTWRKITWICPYHLEGYHEDVSLEMDRSSLSPQTRIESARETGLPISHSAGATEGRTPSRFFPDSQLVQGNCARETRRNSHALLQLTMLF